MARPACRRRVPCSTMLFRITIQRPRRPFCRSRSRLCYRRGRRCGKTVCFVPSGRPLPPFFIFMRRNRWRVQRCHPNLTMVQTAKRLGRMWRRLPERDKEKYKDIADRMRCRRCYRSTRCGPRMCSRRGLRNMMISFTTKAVNLRNFLMSYL